ncbi:TOMM precursor leader peptide-binding protein, partial [Microbacteriaceae bacterium K1510]|nr:TOMM precursor leader peptide-binding protein [Microbacteriaceae bacterium K1510]
MSADLNASMSAVVAVVGEGLLADFVYGELSICYQAVRQSDWQAGVPTTADLILVLHDAWHPSAHQETEEALQSSGIPWLRGFVSFGEGVIGPLVRPGTPGCSRCADTRRLLAGRDRKEMWELQQWLAAGGGIE